MWQLPDLSGQQTPYGGSGAYGMNPANPLDFKLGWNAPTLQMGMQGAGMLSNLWGAWQSNRLARDQLDWTKKFANINLNNQIKSYNTALEDRSRSRAAVEGQSAAEAQAYVDRNRLTR
jgi:hypothetical protein